MTAQKRIFDLVLAAFLLILTLPLFAIAALAVKLSSPGPVIHWSKRVGRGKKMFMMAKFRTMRTDAPQLPTHLMKESEKYVTPVGSFLRRTSLDELPQLINVIKGEMSFVGPRPALFNQDDLVALRDRHGINDLVPGITGWAQINGRDDIAIPAKVELERYYFENRSFLLDLRILFLTAFNVIKGQGVRH